MIRNIYISSALLISILIFCCILIILTQVEKFLDKISGDYSLGNIIDVWYYTCVVSNDSTLLADFTEKLEEGTFAKFLTTIKPPTNTNIADISTLLANHQWWFIRYDLIKLIYPHCNESLRYAIQSFNGWDFNDIIDPDTCVIHMRLGDFLLYYKVVNVSDLLNALDRLPRVPKKFEILNGGKFHYTNEKAFIETTLILNSLEEGIRLKFPQSEIIQIESENADKDFYRAVNAPMLVTTTGSFAIMAAIANKNFRLTPAIDSLDQGINTIIPPEHIYENWYTYEIK